jgi:uncharacterized oxidoreductase
VFEHAGCAHDEALSIGTRLTGANLRGHDSHGVIRTPRYVEWLEDGLVHANQTVSIIRETAVLAVLDGHYGFGQPLGEQTVDIGVAKAREQGVAATALRNSGHLGRIGDWAERAASSNVASIHMVNVRGSLLVAPFDGVDRRGSTSPFCAGVPVAGGEPIVHDFATSLVAEGKALVALRGGKPLPEGAIITEHGELTSDPGPLYGDLEDGRYPNPNNGPGAMCGFGAHKGSGLNFMMEMFAGALGGSGTAGALGEKEPRRFCNGMFSIYFDVDHFHADDWFTREVENYVEFFKSSRPARHGGQVLAPGEQERLTMAERQRSGLPFPRMTWDDILGASRKVGMTPADVDALLGSS